MPDVDYAGAIWFPADPSNYRAGPNNPKGWVLHTPEEPADGYPSTPHWFAQNHGDPNNVGSTHYFVAFTGDIYQCVAESDMAIANGVLGKPYPSWADPAVSLNRQTVNVEIEGYAASIQDSLVVGSVQWNALVALVRDRCAAYGIPMDREHIIGHYEVSTDRSDPGAGFPWDEFIAALNEEDEMQPYNVWDKDRKRTYLIGPFGAVYIVDPADGAEFEKLYGPHKMALSAATIDGFNV